MIPAMPGQGQRGDVPLDDPRRWAELGREAWPLGLPRDPREHEALADLLGMGAWPPPPKDRVIPADVAAAWHEGYDAGRAEHPEARQCHAPACDKPLIQYPEPGWRREVCSRRCREARARQRRGEGVRQRQQGR